MNNEIQFKVLRHQEAQKTYGLPRSTYYERIATGLIPTPISLGERAVGQLEHETQAVLAAMISGQSKEQIQALVSSLIEERKSAMRAQ